MTRFHTNFRDSSLLLRRVQILMLPRHTMTYSRPYLISSPSIFLTLSHSVCRPPKIPSSVPLRSSFPHFLPCLFSLSFLLQLPPLMLLVYKPHPFLRPPQLPLLIDLLIHLPRSPRVHNQLIIKLRQRRFASLRIRYFASIKLTKGESRLFICVRIRWARSRLTSSRWRGLTGLAAAPEPVAADEGEGEEHERDGDQA